MIIKKPIITEKSMKLAGNGLYSFVVKRNSRKPEIKRVVEEMFKVNVLAVKTMNYNDLKKSQRLRRAYFVVPGYKKALVQLKSGQKITLFEAEKPAEEAKVEQVKEKKSLLKGTKIKIEKGGGQS